MHNGQTISHYNILSEIGQGGMGMVYRAQDTRLQRIVALKVLRPEAIGDQNAKRRLLREARAASALAHPNITTIYEIDEWQGQDFIAREFKENCCTYYLNVRFIKNSKLEIKNVVDYAVQIAQALQGAHEHNIIHRDIKSENIKITPKGLVKVMDFGLAKMPGMVTKTQSGTTMGTIAYMSPEQTRGDPLDGRTDMWSLGVVLYEMITGELPFKGDYDQAVIYSILNEEPARLSLDRPDIPEQLEYIIYKLLAKDTKERFDSTHDLLSKLRHVADQVDQKHIYSQTDGHFKKKVKHRDGKLGAPKVNFKKGIVRILILVFSIISILILAQYFRKQKSPNPSTSKLLTSYRGAEGDPALSPNGNKLAFTWNGDSLNSWDIYIKLIGENDHYRLTDNQDSQYSATWSNDGNKIAFVRHGDKAGIYCISIYGTREEKLVPLVQRNSNADIKPYVDWSADGTWLAFNDYDSTTDTHSIYKFEFTTHTIVKLTTTDPKLIGDMNPKISPDGKWLAFQRVYSNRISDIFVLNLKNKNLRQKTCDKKYISDLDWSTSSKIIFSSDRSGIRRLWSIGIKDKKPELLEAAGENAFQLSVSRRNNRLAYSVSDPQTALWQANIRNLESNTIQPYRIVPSSKGDYFPVYSPNDQRIAFNSNRDGISEIYACNRDGSDLLQLTDIKCSSGCPRWSPTGDSLIFDARPNGDGDILLVDAFGRNQVRNITNNPADDRIPSWSRDGKYIYFGSNRTKDGIMQIFKQRIDGGDAIQITHDGGTFGYESFDGNYFFYRHFKNRQTSGPIYQIDLATMEESIIIDEYIDGFRWSMEREGIYYIAENDTYEHVLKLYRYPVRAIEEIGVFDKMYCFSDVSNDADYILLWCNNEYAADIYLVENFH